MVERRHRDLPSAVDGSEQAVGGDLDIIEDDFTEGRRRSMPPDGFDGHPGGFEIEYQAGDSAVLGCVWIGAGIQCAPS